MSIENENSLPDKYSEGTAAGERKTSTINGAEFAFRWQPAGSFMMPIREEYYFSNEGEYCITLTKGFWRLETPVTQRQWQAVMGNNPSKFNSDLGFNGNDVPLKEVSVMGSRIMVPVESNDQNSFNSEDYPVENVSWFDCQAFCQKCAELGLPVALPTEAQWEYACRAGNWDYYTGNLSVMAWHKFNSGDKTHCVAKKEPNAWGLYDMFGNVWEWCQDWYEENGSIYDQDDNVTDPTGPSEGYGRLLRGGSFANVVTGFDSPEQCLSETYNSADPEQRSRTFGFRVIISKTS